MSVRPELDVLAQQAPDSPPDRTGAIRQGDLRKFAALSPHVTEIDAAGLATDLPAFKQSDAELVLVAQKKCGRRSHQATADDQHITALDLPCVDHDRAPLLTSCAFISIGLTGA
jgi:hypothetical protein